MNSRLRLNHHSDMGGGSLQKIVIVGTSGSGKSALARLVASRLGIPCVELDSLYWEPDWMEAPIEVFRGRVEAALKAPAWVVEGNYGKVRDSVWKKADTLIWLDYPFHTVFSRALLRTIKRAITREVLWNGNHESFRKSFFSKDSILLWVMQTHRQRRLEHAELIKSPEYQHLRVCHFRSQKDADIYLKHLA